MPAHPFDTAITLEPLESGRRAGHTRPEWANMVGPFGGITAATLLRAAEEHPQRHGDPLALTVNFLAPIAEGSFEISARPVRTNRTNQHWVLELDQDDEPRATGTAVLGVTRESWSDTETTAPVVPAPEQLPSRVAAGDPAEMIMWLRNYDLRFVTGPMPANGDGPGPSSTTTLWARDASGRTLDHAGLAAMCDVFYPRVFLRRGGFVPAGTISVTMYFHASRDELHAQGDDFVLCTAHANRFSGGYFDQSARLWSRSGALLATTHQLVYFKG